MNENYTDTPEDYPTDAQVDALLAAMGAVIDLFEVMPAGTMEQVKAANIIALLRVLAEGQGWFEAVKRSGE